MRSIHLQGNSPRTVYLCFPVPHAQTAWEPDRSITADSQRRLCASHIYSLTGKLPAGRISLQGTTDCAIYPITGYPPMEAADWEKNFRIIKSYGLNHDISDLEVGTMPPTGSISCRRGSPS